MLATNDRSRRFWRTALGDWLVEGQCFPIALGLARNQVRLPDGRLTREAHEYFEITPGGEVRRYYRGPHTWTADDELYVFDIHVVIGPVLHRCTWIEHWRDGDALNDSVCLSGLQPAMADQPPFDAAAIMARHRG